MASLVISFNAEHAEGLDTEFHQPVIRNYVQQIYSYRKQISRKSRISKDQLSDLLDTIGSLVCEPEMHAILHNPIPQAKKGEETGATSSPVITGSTELKTLNDILKKTYKPFLVLKNIKELPVFHYQVTKDLLCHILKKEEKGLITCTTRLTEKPTDIIATRFAAFFYNKKGNHVMALSMYHRLLALTKDPLIHCEMAQIHEKKGNLEKAIHHYQVASDMAPRMEFIIRRKAMARKNLVAQNMRKQLSPNEFDFITGEFIAPLGQGDWKIPQPSPVLSDFFHRWKSSNEEAPNTPPSKRKRVIATKTRKLTDEELLPLPHTVPAQKFQFMEELQDEYCAIPIRKPDNGPPCFSYVSNDTIAEDTSSCSAVACGQRVSLYPRIPGKTIREGGPIRDSFGVSYFRNFSVMAIADGSSVGHTACSAAKLAVRTFITSIEEHREEFINTSHVPEHLLRALASAHNRIITDLSESMGTSSLLGGVLLRREDKLGKWFFICASVGDCKAFHYSPITRKCTEITKGNDFFRESRNDPGGTIGAVDTSQILPDLRNLRLYTHPCEDTDTIFMVSNGVYHNFNPQYLGINPEELQIFATSWNDVPQPEGNRAVSPFILHSIETKLHENPGILTPHRCTHALLNNSLETTQKSRNFTEQNPTKSLPADYSLFPGHLDYASCLSLSVGVFSERHKNAVNLWDYHTLQGDRTDASLRPSIYSITSPLCDNSAISIMVAETKEGIAIICRTIGSGVLCCSADENQVYLTLNRSRSVLHKLENLKKPLQGITVEIQEMEKPVERTVHLPIPIIPKSQSLTTEKSSGLTVIRFARKFGLQ